MEILESRILELEAAIQQLTTKNRRTHRLLLAVVCALSMPFLFGGIVQKKPAVVQASSLEIIRDGKVFASLGSDQSGGLLNMKNSEQSTVVRINASTSGGGNITMNNKFAMGALRLSSSAVDSGSIQILRGTTPIARMGSDTAGYGYLMLNNDKGTTVSEMRMDANGGTLELFNHNGMGGLQMALDGTSAGTITVRDNLNQARVQIEGNTRNAGSIHVRYAGGQSLGWIGKGVSSLFSVMNASGQDLLKAP